MKIFRAVASVGAFTALSRVTGLIREILMTHIIGAGIVADAFVVAFKLPNFFRRFFAEGAFNAAFVPLFAKKLESDGKAPALKLAIQVFWYMAFFLLGLVLFVEFTVPWLIHVIAPGFASTPERLELAISFTRITFPYILMISLAALLAGVLNSFNKFSSAAAAPILLNLTTIAALMFYGVFGMEPAVALCWSVFLAGILQFLWMYFECHRIDMRIKFQRPKLTPSVKKVIKLMTPGAIGAGIMQINIFIDLVLASLLPAGALSFLYYADRLNQLPLSMFGIALGTVLLPLLSKQLRAKNLKAASNSQNTSVELAMQLTIPSAIGYIVLSYPIIELIYGHGAFTASDVANTAPTLAAFAIGLPAYVLSKIFSATFFAHHDTTTPVKIAGISVACNLILNLILMWPFAHVGMALATAVAAWVNAGLLYKRLRAADKITIRKDVFVTIAKVCGASTVMAGSLMLVKNAVFSIINHRLTGLSSEIAIVTSLIFIGIIVYGLVGIATGAINIQKLKQNMTKESKPS